MKRSAEHESKLRALREMLNASIARGGRVLDEDLQKALDAEAAELAKEGF